MPGRHPWQKRKISPILFYSCTVLIPKKVSMLGYAGHCKIKDFVKVHDGNS